MTSINLKFKEMLPVYSSLLSGQCKPNATDPNQRADHVIFIEKKALGPRKKTVGKHCDTIA